MKFMLQSGFSLYHDTLYEATPRHTMKIVMFSMTPLFANKSMGGAQKQLKKIALYLASLEHSVTLLCTYREPDATEAFQWADNVQVIPTYRFKQPFPEPYDTPIYNIANAIRITQQALAQADVFYNHDGGLIFPYVYQNVPAVVSLRSVLFGETLQSGFLFNGDALIVPSNHTAQTWLATHGQFFPQLKDRLYTIPNGLDFKGYHPDVNWQPLAQRLNLEPNKYAYVLYPHRPEDAKGIRQTIRVAERLLKTYHITHFRVLVPQWIDTTLAPHVKAYYDSLKADIAERGLSEYFIFHEWISDDDMPSYFALGAVTLAIGNYVETFGNTPYESLACGTLPIVANVGAYRGMLKSEFLVDYDDLETTADRAYQIINQRLRTTDEQMRWLQHDFSLKDMVEAYAGLILNQPKLRPMKHTPAKAFTAKQRFTLAPWCYITEDVRLFHDFKGGYIVADSLIHELNTRGYVPANHPELDHWLHEGLIVFMRER
jgi:glycosyltransferase involved in cell wall biosynthesis